MRLSFFVAAAAALAACMPADGGETRPADAARGQLGARPAAPAAAGAVEPGVHRLQAGGALLYVPKGYRHDRPAPLLVMLHGAGGSAEHSIALGRAHADRLGFLLLAPKSKAQSWDIISARSYGSDVRALDAALREAFAGYAVDAGRIGIGGFSDGASYALSIGLINGELFRDVVAFAPGFVAPGAASGRPRIFISHGTRDRVLPIDACSRRIVPRLESGGYEVDYREFEGGHEVPERIAREALERFARG